jgi:G3E family GTPase
MRKYTPGLRDPVPMTVITGFLGSGKTTLIAKLLRRPELARTAVIINEFGDVGLDHELIESSEEDLVELSTGCLCCVMRGDLTNAVGRLMARRNQNNSFDRIILETTGLADPAPIVHAVIVDSYLRALVRLDRVVVTVDALTGIASLDAHEESRRQVALADVLLLTKTDIDAGDVPALGRRFARINPDATIFHTDRGEINPMIIIGSSGVAASIPSRLAATPAHDQHCELVQDHAHHHAHDEITSVSLLLDRPIRAVALTLFLQALAETMGPDLLRLKGIVAVAEAPDTPAVVHGVQHVFHPMRWLDAWPDGTRQSRLVLIGKRLSAGWVAALLETIEVEVAQASGQ